MCCVTQETCRLALLRNVLDAILANLPLRVIIMFCNICPDDSTGFPAAYFARFDHVICSNWHLRPLLRMYILSGLYPNVAKTMTYVSNRAPDPARGAGEGAARKAQAKPQVAPLRPLDSSC